MKKPLFLIKTAGKTEAEILREASQALVEQGIWDKAELEKAEKLIEDADKKTPAAPACRQKS